MTTEYKISRKSFNIEIQSCASSNLPKYLRSVSFIDSEDGKTFKVKAHKHEYQSGMKSVNESEFCF
jgi:hypothetical protein